MVQMHVALKIHLWVCLTCRLLMHMSLSWTAAEHKLTPFPDSRSASAAALVRPLVQSCGMMMSSCSVTAGPGQLHSADVSCRAESPSYQLAPFHFGCLSFSLVICSHQPGCRNVSARHHASCCHGPLQHATSFTCKQRLTTYYGFFQ